MIRATFPFQPVLQTIIKNKEGKISESEPLDSFLVAISKPHTEIYDERITFDVIKIDGELARYGRHINFISEINSAIAVLILFNSSKSMANGKFNI